MDNNDALDALSDTAPLPELSFEDLLENTKNESLIQSLDESLDINDDYNDQNMDEFTAQKNESLNTPGPKKPPTKIVENRRMASSTETTNTSAAAAAVTTTPTQQKIVTTKPLTTPTTTSTVKPKSLQQSSVFRIATAKPDGGIATNVVNIGGGGTILSTMGKTAIKTSAGKIIYIQKATSSVAASTSIGQVRLPAGTVRSVAATKNVSLPSTLTVVQKSANTTGTTTTIVPKNTTISNTLASTSTGVVKTLTTATPSKNQQTTNVTRVAVVTNVTKPLATEITPGTSATTATVLTNTTYKTNKQQQPTNVAQAAAVTNLTKEQTTEITPRTSATATSSVVTVAKVAPKNVPYQIVRTTDGKLIKLNTTQLVSGKTVAAVPGTGTVQLTVGKSIKSEASSTTATAATTASKPIATTATSIQKVTPIAALGQKITRIVSASSQPAATVASRNITTTAATLNKQQATGVAAATKLVSAINSPIVKVTSAAATEANATALSKLGTVVTSTTPDSVKNVKAMPGKIITSLAVPKATPAAGSNKVIIQSTPTGGKQVFVSSQQILKVSPKPLTPTANVIPAGATKMQTVQIPGVGGGIKYVRVIPKGGTIPNVTTSNLNKSVTVSVAKPGMISSKIESPNSVAAVKTNANATTTILNSTLNQSPKSALLNTAGFKILNTTQKYTLARAPQGGNTTKFLLKQSPSKDGPVSVVSIPTKKTGTPLAAGTIKTVGAEPELVARKHKISDINMEIQRITSGDVSETAVDEKDAPEAKKPRYVYMPRTIATQQSNRGNEPNRPVAGARTSYTIQRMVTTAPGAGSIAPMKSYMITNAATGQKSITLRRPEMLNETAIGRIKKITIENDLDKREKLLEDSSVPSQRTQYTTLKPENKPQQYEVLKQFSSAASTTSSTNAIAATAATAANAEPEGATLITSRRKHCNCSKSQCLKLYCDCFANGEFCQDCTCKDCFNNLENEDERLRAIKSCLDRNPSAFKPKITARQHSDMRLHNKGCNCKRSGCLKNYCECYEAKIPCSSICKCVGCRNMDEAPDTNMDSLNVKTISGLSTDKRTTKEKPEEVISTSNNFITEDVIDATIMCMISQLGESEKHDDLPIEEVEKQIMEELGRCLVEIIDFSIRNSDSILLDDSKTN